MKLKSAHLKSIILTALLGLTILIQAQENEFKIEVKTIDASKALIIKAEVPTSQIAQSMGEVYGKLFGYLGQNQIQPAGPVFAVYTKYEPEGNTAFEAGVPINNKIEVSGEIVYMEYPAMKVVSAFFKGPYENMMPVYEAIDKYIKANNLKIAGGSWEVYLTDPSQTAPEDYQTLVYFPVE